MKKLLWTSAMAIAAVACLTACDETSSSSYEIPSYASDTSLPDTCSMEVAKVDTAYFACFENKWIEVTDSATIEQLKEGLDEEEIKAKLEELQSLLPKPADNTPKPTSSSAQGEVEGSDNEGDSSSSSEEEESSSSSKKKKDKDKDDSGSGSGEGGSGEGGETTKKCGGVTYDPETQVCGEGDKVLPKCGKGGYDPETQVCEGNVIKDVCGTKKYVHQENGLCIEEDYYYTNTSAEPDEMYLIDKRDNNTYRFIAMAIGEDNMQLWTAQNMNYETASGSACYKDPSDCDTYGRLYDWETAQNACPNGWHLPTKAEYSDLISLAGNNSSADNLRSKSDWPKDYEGKDLYGFSVLPAGARNSSGPRDKGNFSYIWTATTDGSSSSYAYYVIFYYARTGAYFVSNSKGFQSSVRCKADNTTLQTLLKAWSD